MPVGIAGGDERVQIATGALGQGPDADGEENPAARNALERTGRRESGSVLPPHGEYQLPADGISLDYFASGDDRAFLSGLVSGAGDRLTALHRVHVLDFVVLSCSRARHLSEDLEEDVPLSAVHHGSGHRTFSAKCDGSDGSNLRSKIRIRAH